MRKQLLHLCLFMSIFQFGISQLLAQSPTVTANGPTTFCAGGNVVLTSSSATGNRWYRNGTAISGGIYQNYTAITTGAYTLKVSGVPSLDTVKVKANPVPAATISPAGTAGTVTICEGSTISLTSSSAGVGGSYSWSTGATTRAIPVSTAGSFYVKVTNSYGCSRTSAVKNTVIAPLPSALTISAQGSTTFCSGGNVVLEATEASAYQWYRGTTKISGATNKTYTATLTGSYTVRAYNGTCYSQPSNAIGVTVYALPVATISPTGISNICKGSSITLTASSAGTGGSYSWSTGATSRSIVVTEGGNYTVTLRNSRGCTKTSAAKVVNVLPPVPTITAGGPTTFCDGDSVTLTSSEAASYLWSNGSTNKSITVYDAGNYNVRVTDNSGCSNNSDDVAVTVNNATADLGTDQNLYIGYGPTSLNLSATVTGEETFTYAWSNGANSSNIEVAPAQTTSYDLTVTDNNGCIASDNITVNVIDVRCGKEGDKVLICHTDTLTGEFHSICVDNSAVVSHLDHGDYLGECADISSDRLVQNPSKLEMDVFNKQAADINIAPNPFFNQTTLNYSIKEDSQVKIEVFNLLGEKVASVFNGKQSKGYHTETIDLSAQSLANAVYFVKFLDGEKLTVLRIVKAER